MRNGEGGGAVACSGGRRGRRRRGRARGVEAGAAKTRWHGAGDGGAPVSGRGVEAAELGRRSGTAAEQEARMGDDGGAAQIRNAQVWRKAEVKGHI